MGHKVRPNSLRLGIIEDWNAQWFAKRKFHDRLEEDEMLRGIVTKNAASAGIASMKIERTGDQCKVTLRVARPGIVIGRGGKGIEAITKTIESALRAIIKKRGQGSVPAFSLTVEEVRRPEISAPIVAKHIAEDLEKRIPFRRTMKKYIEAVMQNREAQGVKIKLSGRLDGAEISRREALSRGKLPLQTLRANIDYGTATAFASYGTVGIKVWIYKGEVFPGKK
ncbi:MAG TPA: 30S ribosomal protein S3 [Candidatus Omnitrophota bacterium]|nr:30S ribosomal protein S3 [Candidatus Omnitrophota bacterium]